MTGSSAEAIVRRFVSELWGGPRPDLIEVLVHEHYRVNGEEVGRDFLRRNLARTRRGFSDFSPEITDLVSDGARVAVMVEWTGTHDGPFAGIEPTGRRVRFREACFFRVEDGTVIEGDFVADGLDVRIQLGILPEDFWTNPHR